MIIPISLLLQFVGLFAGVKLLRMNVNMAGIAVLTLVPLIPAQVLPGMLGLVVAIIAFVVILRLFDNTAGFLEVLGILIISVAVQLVLIDLIVEPMLMRLLS